MKIELLLCASFTNILSLFSLISANKTNVQLLENAWRDHKLENITSTDGRAAEKQISKEDSSTSSNVDDELVRKKAARLVKQLHIIKIKPEYEYMKRRERKFSDKSRYLRLPIFQHDLSYLQQLFDDQPEKRRFTEPYYPMFYRRSHSTDYGRNSYHPYFYPKNYIYNFGKRFMDKRKHFDNFLFDNRDRYPEKLFPSSDLEETPPLLKGLPAVPLLSLSDGLRAVRNFSTDSSVDTNETDLSGDVSASQSIQSNIKQETSHRSSRKSENLPDITSRFLQGIRSNNDSSSNHFQRQIITNKEYLGENEILGSNSETSPHEMSSAEERNESSSIHHAEIRNERTNSKDDLKIANSNPITNRVYYERYPSNMSLSWFVYVNCSRERCLFTNSTNETELMSEGWSLHNCTSYGCTEMYPKSESIQRFIGLMLLVFSLCILKILAFVLVFYYCRHLQLSKQVTEDRNPSSWEKGKSDFSGGNEQVKDNDNVTTSRGPMNQTEDFEPTFSPQKDSKDLISSEKDTKSNPLAIHEVLKDNSKVWVPPVQRVSPCLLASTPVGNILIPKKVCEKKTPDIKNSDELKYKRRYRSNIPRLERFVKCNNRNSGKMEVKDTQQSVTQKTTKQVRATVDGGGDLLLMNLEDEISNPKTTVEAPNWESLLEEECKSFVSLDLNDYEK